uniref:Uncharacterized protein n=1 Tax=Rhizophora mucronata TaxID=61149 RepID=A0A2P2MY46_RHIMU
MGIIDPETFPLLGFSSPSQGLWRKTVHSSNGVKVSRSKIERVVQTNHLSFLLTNEKQRAL